MNGLFLTLSNRSRLRKLEVFSRLLRPTEESTVLDVGGQVTSRDGETLQFLDLYPWKDRVTVLNMLEEHVKAVRLKYPEVHAVRADACQLPWPDGCFDIVYSNAVIEHVGSREAQEQMAREVMRVGRSWFITTPNRWFPFEFHMRLPMVTWLPRALMNRVGKLASYNHVQRCYCRGREWEELRLLSTREVRALFPGSTVVRQRVTVWPETLIAVGGERVCL